MTELSIGHAEITEEQTEEQPKLRHWRHPTDETIWWCGSPRKARGYKSTKGAGSRTRTCPMCDMLDERLGMEWWWETHRRWFNSDCEPGWYVGDSTFHNCPGSA